ncbi:glycoprotein 38 family [Trichomonas vaginalis G3]|uniref:glycoprotein 38 family n=1 Tax=Trichomonas vaginalis (strain ATCC PRA-98 / G3) TaxID=412133 RepID=UPI0021E57BEA|nr:glycoprotein 38 family [Trichomonas vaginalis G3]KAI5536719.1 glycoprotein 38 family [Trichomonas vaginalis G3]
MIAFLLLGYRNLTISEQRAIMAESEIYDLDVYKAFTECTDFGAMFMNPIVNKIGYTTFDLQAGESVCIVGSMVIGGSGSYHVDAAIAKSTDDGPKWETISKDNAIFVVPDVKAKVDFSKVNYVELAQDLFSLVTVLAPPVSKIKCNDGAACTVQIHPVPPSYSIDIKNSKVYNVDVSFKLKNVFSTKESGSFDIKYKTSGDISATSFKASIDFTQGLYLSSTKKKFTYSRDEKVDFIAGNDDNRDTYLFIPCHEDKEGTIATSKSNWFIPFFNVKDIFSSLSFSLNPIKDNIAKAVNVDGKTTISWSPVSSAASTTGSKSSDPDKVYYEERTYNVPEKGGAYDKDDVKEYSSSSDDPWYIKYKTILIIVGAVIVVAIVATLTVIILMKKSKKNNNKSGNGNKGADAV